MEFYENLVKKVEENNITWCIPDSSYFRCRR